LFFNPHVVKSDFLDLIPFLNGHKLLNGSYAVLRFFFLKLTATRLRFINELGNPVFLLNG